MSQRFCPHLGAPLDDETRGPAQDYPSFENRCYAVEWITPDFDEMESRDQLLLADQATYCLGSGHKLCPRFRLLTGQPPIASEFVAVADSPEDGETSDANADPLLVAELRPELIDDFAARPRLGLWIGAASLFVVLLLCGGSLAIYTGWQLVGRGLLPIGQRLAQVSAPPEQNQIFLLVTPTPATSPTPVGLPTVPILVQQPSLLPTPQATFAFPQAVTPTPGSSLAAQILNNAADDVASDPASDPAAPVQQTGPVVITTPTPTGAAANTGVDPSDPQLATAVAAPVITTPDGLTAPTRRPTPTFAVPTSTPGDPTIIVVTATPTPDYPDAVIEFRAAHQSVLPRDCTTLYWRVENVRAVFFDNEGVWGQGERRVCLDQTSNSYTLSVLLMDGREENRTITVEVLPYTPTPTPTPTFTPVLTPTPTWTPQGTPSATVPAPQYGVSLAADGGNQRGCAVGQVCELVIQVQNTGNLADEIFLDLAKDGAWTTQICRGDGLCGETAISLGIGPGNQLPVYVRVTVPADAAGQSANIQINAASGNSNRSVRAEAVYVTLIAQ